MQAFAPCWDIGFPHRTNVMVPMHTATMMKAVSGVHTAPMVAWLCACAIAELALFWTRYVGSWLMRSEFHRHVDVICERECVSCVGCDETVSC
jgi:hypothetical protein